MELYQLKTFIAVAETSNVTRAAQILHTTPPSVSNHIRQIEEELEISLFTRTPKGMFITSQGKVLLDQARQILASAEKLKILAWEMKSDVKGSLSLAINSTPEFLKVPDRFKSRLSFVYAQNRARDILVMTMDSIIHEIWNLKYPDRLDG